MTEQKKKTQRPRVDGIANAIRRGEYDDKIGDLQQAINDRNEARKAAVLAQVKEVFGEGYDVLPQRTDRVNPFKDPKSPDYQPDAPEPRQFSPATPEDPDPLEPEGEPTDEVPIHLRGAVIGPPGGL